MRSIYSVLLCCLLSMAVFSSAWAEKVITVSPVPNAPSDAQISPDMPASEGEEAPEAEAPPEHVKPGAASPAAEKPKVFNAVRLQGLDKVTARTSTIDAVLGAVTRFGNLEIIARKCWQAPPEAQPENAALLEIRELKPGEGPKNIFTGWMFASSPALSALEHPVYDITVIECESLKNAE